MASGAAKPGDDRFIVESPGTVMPAPKPTPAAKPARVTTSATTAPSGKYVVQVGAFSTEARANAAAKSVGGHVTKAGNLWRVRVGPFASDADARGALGKVKGKGAESGSKAPMTPQEAPTSVSFN